jgi:hypothetical protein
MTRFKVHFVPVHGRSFSKTVEAVDDMQAVRKASLKVPKSKLPMASLSVKRL